MPAATMAAATGVEPQIAVSNRQYVSWPAIFAGNAVTAGFILVLLPLGVAAGLSMTSPYANLGAPGSRVGMVAIFWLAFTYLFSVAAGGYVAGRLRPRVEGITSDEVRFRDGINGFIFWGVGMIISAIFTFMTVTAAIGTATRAIGQAAGGIASGAGSAASSVAPSIAPNISTDYVTDLFLRTATPNGQQPQQPQAAGRSDQEARAEIGRIVARSAMSGEVDQNDRTYLAQIVAQRTGLPENEAKARVDDTINKATAMRDQAAAKAKDVAEQARKGAAQAAFWTALASLLTGIVAWYAAQLGGRHRDENRF